MPTETVLDDGVTSVTITNKWLNRKNSKKLFKLTLKISDWTQHTYNFDGVIRKPSRKMYCFCDEDVVDSVTKKLRTNTVSWSDGGECGLLWKAMRDRLYKETDIYANAVLINYYPDGSAAITKHSDNEVIRKVNNVWVDSPIIGLSLGCTRKFFFEPIPGVKNTIKKTTIEVKSGSLMIMWDGMQLRYLHGIPYEKSITDARISGTFRNF